MPSPLLCQSGVDNAAGHGSATSECLLSELGFLDRDQRLPDELNKLECYPRVYQGLYDPDTAGSQHIADRDSDSDWDVVSPDVVMLPPGAANNCLLHSLQVPDHASLPRSVQNTTHPHSLDRWSLLMPGLMRDRLHLHLFVMMYGLRRYKDPQ